MMNKKQFYMVYLEEGRTPVFKHESYESALKEARRLAKEHERKAYVLGTITSVELSLFKEECVTVNEIKDYFPF